MINKKLKILSLFAGAGGMDLGFKNAGFDIVWANDFDPDSVKTYKRNLHYAHATLIFVRYPNICVSCKKRKIARQKIFVN